MQTLIGKKVLVVGASSGIGAETVKLLVKSSAQVFIAARREDKLLALAEELQIPRERVIPTDVSRAESVEALAQAVLAQVPQLDVLINAAGIGIIKPLEQLSYEDFERSVDVNLKGAFYLLKAFLPGMKAAKKGLIVHIPGVLGKTPMAGAGAYAASKYGLNGLLKSVREELRRTEVRITNLYLGGTDTPFWNNIDLKVQREQFVLAQEAARAIWFLCQQPSSGVVSEMVIQPFNHQAI